MPREGWQGRLLRIGALVLAIALLAVVEPAYRFVRAEWLGTPEDLDRVVAELKILKPELDRHEPQVSELEKRIEATDIQIREAEYEIRSIEAQAVDGALPSPQYQRLQDLLTQTNRRIAHFNQLLAQARTVFAEYDQRVEAYNRLVVKANRLGPKLDPRWQPRTLLETRSDALEVSTSEP